MNRNTYTIGLVVVSLILGFIFGAGYGKERVIVLSTTESAKTVALIVNGSKATKVFAKESITPGESVFKVLEKLQSDGKLDMKYKDFGGDMGVFISELSGEQSDKDKWWQYWVNGQYATIGASNYKLNPGDVVEFRLTGEMPTTTPGQI